MIDTTELFDDMICYDPYATILGKARRVYILCIRSGHTDLAKKIWNKHSKYKATNSDLVMSFQMLLSAQKNKQQGL